MHILGSNNQVVNYHVNIIPVTVTEKILNILKIFLEREGLTREPQINFTDDVTFM